MSIDRRFIRVTNQWSEAFTPGDNDQYVVNISGFQSYQSRQINHDC